MSLQIDIYLPHTLLPIQTTDKETIKKFCHHYSYRENPNYQFNPSLDIKPRYNFYLWSQQLTKSISKNYYLEINKKDWIPLLFREDLYSLELPSYTIKVEYNYHRIILKPPKPRLFCLPSRPSTYRTIGPMIKKLTIETNNYRN